MVSLVQLVEHQIVVLGVMGSSPIGYPKEKRSVFTGLFSLILQKLVNYLPECRVPLRVRVSISPVRFPPLSR